MTDTYKTTYARTTTDKNGERLTIGDRAVLPREGRFVLGTVTDIRNPAGLGDIVTIETHTGERISCCADVLALSRRQTTRRVA